MKKNLFLLGGIGLLGAATLFLNGCKKDDTTPPVVSLNGDANMTISLNSAFNDPGASATDDKDGTVSVSHTGTVDKDTKGDYSITYSASDAAGNTGSATRTVHVVNDAESWAGNYSVNDSILTYKDTVYAQTITTDSKVNNRIRFSLFAAYSNNTGIYATITGGGNIMDLPSQSVSGIGKYPADTHTFTGSNGTRNGTTITFTYTDHNSFDNSTATDSTVWTKLP